MDAKAIALIAVAVLGLVCLAPLVAEDTSAETQEIRISNKNVYRADTKAVANSSTYSYYYYMIDGSDNHKAMENYIKNPKTAAAPTGDDRGYLNWSVGSVLHIYYATPSYASSSIQYGGNLLPSKMCLQSFGPLDYIDYDVGDTVSIRIIGASSDGGDDYGDNYLKCRTYDSDPNTLVYPNSTFTFTVDDETEVTIEPYSNYGLYYNLKCDIRVSSPDGSATTFIAVCFIMSAITIALLALGALKPKWSK